MYAGKVVEEAPAWKYLIILFIPIQSACTILLRRSERQKQDFIPFTELCQIWQTKSRVALLSQDVRMPEKSVGKKHRKLKKSVKDIKSAVGNTVKNGINENYGKKGLKCRSNRINM